MISFKIDISTLPAWLPMKQPLTKLCVQGCSQIVNPLTHFASHWQTERINLDKATKWLGATTSSKNALGPESSGWVGFQGLVHKDPQLKFLVLKFHGEIKTLRFQSFPAPPPSKHCSQCSTVEGTENLQYFGNQHCPVLHISVPSFGCAVNLSFYFFSCSVFI